jgi:hypothetical protein
VSPPSRMSRRKRPAPPQSRPSRNTTNALSITRRCRRCRRPLTAPLSLFFGAGPVCRRHILDQEPNSVMASHSFEGELSTAVDSFADDLAVAR